MANTLGNPTLVSNKSREAQVTAQNTVFTSSPAVANPILRIRIGATTIVDFTLDGTTPFTVGGEDGIATFNFTSTTATATGGTASVPDNYQVIGRDSAVHWSGLVTGSEAISTGQVVDAQTITVTAPAT